MPSALAPFQEVYEYKSAALAQAAIDQSAQSGHFVEGESIDHINYLSPYLSLAAQMPDQDPPHAGYEGHMEDDVPSKQVKWFLSHYFQDETRGHSPVKATIQALKSDLSDDEDDAPSFNLNQPYIDRLFHTWGYDDFEFNSPYLAVTTALDDHQADYRDHIPRNMWPRDLSGIAYAPEVSFEGTPRACAGGIAVDGVHSFTLTGTLIFGGQVLPGSTVQLSFEGNKGHDYSQDPVGVKPDGWTPADIKRARLVASSGQGAQGLVEEMTTTTDAQGKFTVTVLSSDIITSKIKLLVKYQTPEGDLKPISKIPCNFVEATAIRRFRNQYDDSEPYPSGDDGWLFEQKWLASSSAQTTGKIYLKFMVDPQQGDVDGNWKFVNGHKMLFEIDHVDFQSGASSPSDSLSDYAFVVPTEHNLSLHPTISDGAATTLVQAGPRISDARTVWVAVHDQSQWSQ